MRAGGRGAGVAVALATLLAGAGCRKPGLQPIAGSQSGAWQEHQGNPIIAIGKDVAHLLWNDPSVLREGDGGYRMWLSGGDPRDRNHIVVQVYEARSPDGLAWRIDPEPLVRPGAPGTWDSLRIETPSVVEVGGVYHMYYSGGDEENARNATLSIGHATSSDGRTWTKDPANPVVSAHKDDPHQWGFRGVGEPGVVYDAAQGLFNLYYVGMRFSRSDPSIGHLGILLARSKDGSRFVNHTDDAGQRAPVLTRDIPGARSGAWFGYSGPAGLVSSRGELHLFCVFIVLPKGPATVRHVAIDHAVSRDGVHFEVVEKGLFEAGKGDWKDQHVRSPSALEVDGRLGLWFAGETRKPYFAAGIGFARRPEPWTPTPERLRSRGAGFSYGKGSLAGVGSTPSGDAKRSVRKEWP